MIRLIWRRRPRPPVADADLDAVDAALEGVAAAGETLRQALLAHAWPLDAPEFVALRTLTQQVVRARDLVSHHRILRQWRQQ
jgi:hypothetical protein